MKGLIQRVTSASVTVDGKVVSSIGQGLCVLVGINRDDAPKHADWLAKKVLNLRLFDGDNDRRWDKSVKDKQLEVLCVSQFTLDWILKGNKPDFHLAMPPELSQPFYENFLQIMKDNYSEDKIKDGLFGAMMQVHIQNDGPVTLMLETPDNLPVSTLSHPFQDPKQRKPQNNTKQTNPSKGKTKESPSDKQTESSYKDISEAAGDS